MSTVTKLLPQLLSIISLPPPRLGFMSWKIRIKPIQYFRATLQWHHHFQNYRLNLLLTTSLASRVKPHLLT